jgi:hypothetical protein
MTKIQAMKTLHFVDAPWENWEVFLWVCMSVNGFYPDFEMMQAPTAAQTMVAIDIFFKVRQDVQWSEEIKVYLGTVWRADGILQPIPPADFFAIDTEGLPLDIESVKARWPEVLRSGVAPIVETVENEQLRRLLVVHRHLLADRARLDGQLPLVLDG